MELDMEMEMEKGERQSIRGRQRWRTEANKLIRREELDLDHQVYMVHTEGHMTKQDQELFEAQCSLQRYGDNS